jgi:hypothetical protein
LTVTLFIEGLLGHQESVGQAACVAGKGDAGLDRDHAAGAEFGVAFGEPGRVERESPGDAHGRVAVFGQALAGDPATTTQGG